MTNRGYVLIETLLATVLLVSGIVHLATLFSFTEGISIRNRQRTAATLLLYNKMEQLQSTPSPFGGGLDPTHPVPGFTESDPQTPYLLLWQKQSAQPYRVTIAAFARMGSSAPLELARATALLSPH
jgi:hypothetical protein